VINTKAQISVSKTQHIYLCDFSVQVTIFTSTEEIF